MNYLSKENQMKKRISMLGAICMALILVAMPFVACTGPAGPAGPAGSVGQAGPAGPATPTPAVTPVSPAPAGETEYSVLDPRGIEPEREFQAINPRLDTLSGKKVGVVNLHGGNEIVMTTIVPAIKALVPDCNAVYYDAEIEFHQKRTEGDWAFIESCDAVIIGHDY